MEDALPNKMQVHDYSAEWLITKLLLDPALVETERMIQRAKLIDSFMEEHGGFTNRRGIFAKDT